MANNFTYEQITGETEALLWQYQSLYEKEKSSTEREYVKAYAFGAYQAWVRIAAFQRRLEDELRLKKLTEFV